MSIELYSLSLTRYVKHPVKVAGIIFTICGVVLLLGGFYVFFDSWMFTKHAIQTTGTVSHIIKRQSHGINYYHPEVTFITIDKNISSFTSHFGSNPAVYTKGETLPVLYVPNNPRKAEIKNIFYQWGFPLFITFFGGISIIAGIALFTKLKNVEVV